MAFVSPTVSNVNIGLKRFISPTLLHAEQALSSGELPAVDRFRSAVEEDPSDAAAHLHLGVALLRSGEPTLARGALLRATELCPDDAEAWYQLGTALTEMGLVDEAAEAYRTVLSLYPSSSDGGTDPAQVALANVLLDGKGDRELARRVFERACAAGPGPISLLAGMTAKACGDGTAARRHFEGAVDFNPYNVHATLHLMVCCHLEGDEASAAQLRRRLPDDVADSWDYVLAAAPELVAENSASLCYFTHDMMRIAMDAVDDDNDDGLLLEFGVFHGKTIRMIASRFSNHTVHGFDTFSGLPEDWRGTSRGAYSTQGALPSVPDNVQFHVGLFSDTLPLFLQDEGIQNRPIRLMNIDCDLYSSTKDVFDAIHERVVPGTVIVFDEYVMNPKWREDEYKAFQEAVKDHGWTYKYIGISLATGQAVVQIL